MEHGWTKIALLGTMDSSKHLEPPKGEAMQDPLELMTVHTTEDSDDKPAIVATGLERPTPRLILLYHSELDRIGSSTAPDLLEGGSWVQLGRNTPRFVPLGEENTPAPLGDRHISRLQADIRWIDARGVFEVRPAPAARKPVARVVLGTRDEPVRIEPLTELTELPPGSLLSVGKRALILLDRRAWRAPTDNRMSMIGETPQVWKLRKEIKSVARFERSVLILGETGAGKELVARAIHANSPRADQPFVAVNCAALPEHLVESLLFGHKKGAFTGAYQDRPGLFQEANGGCLFLDELGELPMEIQAKLLRVSQDGLLTPVGSHRNISIDVRIIAATNRDPTLEIDTGNLRKDLYYRIAAHTLNVPNLQERIWDVPLLFLHMLHQTRNTCPELRWLWEASPASKPPMPMSFILTLMRYPWEGNVRELQNIAEQTARLNLEPGPFTVPSNLSQRPVTTSGSPAHPTTSSSEPLGESLLKKAARHLGIARQTLVVLLRARPLAPPEPMESFEAFARQLHKHLSFTMLDLLEQNDYNQVQLASELNLSRSTVIKLIRTLDLKRPQDLSTEELQKAAQQNQGDIDAMATTLRVSPRALKLHLTRQKLEHLLS